MCSAMWLKRKFGKNSHNVALVWVNSVFLTLSHLEDFPYAKLVGHDLHGLLHGDVRQPHDVSIEPKTKRKRKLF